MFKIKTGINGFGRFALHLLKYWLERKEKANFDILYINDENLNKYKLLHILKNDKFCKFDNYKFFLDKNDLIIKISKKIIYKIKISTEKLNSVRWLDKVDYLLECSGKNTKKKNFTKILKKNKSLKVLLSATSWSCDQTIIYGFNHTKINEKSRYISYGSCTVNAYVPLANFLNKNFKVVDSDVNVIHNIQNYKLKEFNTLKRKFCTLEKSGPNLLNFLNNDNFKVNYTVVPYDGVSIFDFRFKFIKKIENIKFKKILKNEIKSGSLKKLYSISKFDKGPEKYKFTTSSAVIIESSIEVKKNMLYFSSYFDNENSVNRYFDLINYISS